MTASRCDRQVTVSVRNEEAHYVIAFTSQRILKMTFSYCEFQLCRVLCLSHCVDRGRSQAKQQFCCDEMDIAAWFPGWGLYSCEVPRLGQMFLRVFQDGTCSCEVSMMGRLFLLDSSMVQLPQRGFQDGTAAPARFPKWDSCPCEVSKMGQLPLRGFQNGTAAPARFPKWDSCPCEVSKMGQLPLRGFQYGTAACEVSKMGQLPLRGFQDGTAAPARFPRWDSCPCEVSKMG